MLNDTDEEAGRGSAALIAFAAGTRDEAVAGLQSAAGFLRRLVAKELTTRIVPELHFVLDRNFEHAQRINQLLAELKPGEETA